MPPKKNLQCFTKQKKDGGKYVTCVEGQKKAQSKEKKPIKFKVKKEAPVQAPRNLIKGFGIKRIDNEAKLKEVEKVRNKMKQEQLQKLKNEPKLTVGKLKQRIKAFGNTGFGNKEDHIGFLASLIADDESGFKELENKVRDERIARRKKDEEDSRKQKLKDIEQAKKQNKKPTQSQIDALRTELPKRNIALGMMKGSAYKSIRNDSDLNFAHRHRVAINYKQ